MSGECDGEGPGVAPPPVGQLRWRTRRGMRELDLMLQRYLDNRYPSAPEAEQAAFAEFLEQTDADILDWLLGRSQPPSHLADVVKALSPGS